jgi:iron complex transport system substrate-binding protein
MRIVSHTCSNTEIVCALGRADWLVGVDDHSDYPPEVVGGLPRVGPDLDVDVERIRGLEPDLVITSLTVPGHERCLERLEEAGLPVLVTRPHTLADVAADIRRIGEALDANTRAAKLAETFDEVAAGDPPAHDPLPILVEWWPKPVIAPARDSWVNEMLALAGARNPWAALPGESLQITAEMARAESPEAIVMSWCGVEEAKYRPHVVRRRADWNSVPAIRNDRIFPLSEAWLGRPGPRLLDGIERLRKIVARVRADGG